MLNNNNPIIKDKAGLFNLAEYFGNVSKVCGYQEILSSVIRNWSNKRY